MNRPLIALAGLIVAGGTAGGALTIASPGGEEEAVRLQETATPAASASPSPTLPSESLTPTGSADLPPPAEGYAWFAPDAYSPVSYEVQVPKGWGLRGSDDATKHFVPPDVPSNFPYPDIPRLTVVSARKTVGALWSHAAELAVGQQFPGGGCQGDIDDGIAQPSATQMIGSVQWEFFAFTCSISSAGFPPGVKYQGQAWETYLADVMVAIVFIQSPDVPFDPAILEHALNTFQVR